MITNKVELNFLAKQQWKRPEAGLKRLQVLIFFSRISPEIGGSRTWRKEPFKKYHEEFQAALFAYGLSQKGACYPWEYCYGERADHDCAVRCHIPEAEGGLIYKAVQLKELVPGELDPQSSLQAIINSLAKYTAKPAEESLVVAIYINRKTCINFQELSIPKLQIQQLWLYGFLDEDGCFLAGNLLGHSKQYDFPYPSFQAC